MKKLLLISKRAFYPVHWSAFELVCKKNNLEGFVITTRQTKIPPSHRMLGTLGPSQSFNPQVEYMSGTIGLIKNLQKIKPDYIWLQEEPINKNLLIVLTRYFFTKDKPQIICAVCENIFHPARGPFQTIRTLLWSRINGLLPVTAYSLTGVRDVGMPKKIPTANLAAGFISPPKKILEFTKFQRKPEDFVVGFVGRLVPEKGWRTLFESLEYLPKYVKVLMVGSGGEEEVIDKLIINKYKGQVYRFNIMEKTKLWGVYKKMDCLVLPSIDREFWKEQSGGVLADAMSLGIPVIGSNSGGIPDIIGNAGLIFPQKDAKLLANRINQIINNKKLRILLTNRGLKRFDKEFSINSYSNKIAKLLDIN